MATGVPRRGDAGDSLERAIERLSVAFDRLATRLELIEHEGAHVTRFTRHIRRFAPFYALATVWALIIGLIPFRLADNGSTQRVDRVTQGAAAPQAGSIAATSGPQPPGQLTATEAQAHGAPGSRPDVGNAPGEFDPLAWTATGRTKGGFDCKPGVRQLPWSAYAVPCVPKWSGDNGGATSRGVTSTEIVIVNRTFEETANSQASAAFAQSVGAASPEVAAAAAREMVKFFNKTFELWGRQVKIVDYASQFGDPTEESRGQGKEGACADARVIANELKAFGVVGGGGVFSECAALNKLVVFASAAYYPESFYRKHHPYLWNGVTDCERAIIQFGEYIGKRLAHKPARWAKGQVKNKPRKFGIYVPNNDAYQTCANRLERDLREKYQTPMTGRFNYTIDLARYPDEATTAIIQLKAAGVTTLIQACDPYATMFQTQVAKSQDYYPEWLLIGGALQDTDNAARLWEPDVVRGSLFGLSQLGATGKVLGPDSEPSRTYKAATGTPLPAGTDGGYFPSLLVFNFLQAAGPTLTPDTMASSIVRIPPSGAPRFDVGYVSWQDGSDGRAGAGDHTGIDDAREIYWVAERTAYDGKNGAYVETYGGKRFRNGEWPKEDPPIYP